MGSGTVGPGTAGGEQDERVQAGPVRDAHGVSTRLKYDASLNPPFIVATSMPE
ncbi:hypothetical protein [Streptomyces sp. 147326]|uniref:hypothetical protein n=1 Tax=Streptomyces sp. 147326 TaxID=3074379 RepID=UPI003857F466